MKEVFLRRLYMVWLHFHDILEKPKLQQHMESNSCESLLTCSQTGESRKINHLKSLEIIPRTSSKQRNINSKKKKKKKSMTCQQEKWESFEWNHSPCLESQVLQAETSLQTVAARAWSSQSPLVLSSWRTQNSRVSHPVHSILFLRGSPGWVWSRDGNLFCPRPRPPIMQESLYLEVG